MYKHASRRGLLAYAVLLVALIMVGAASARADITVLLEEPYGYDGALAGTGHTALYLSRVCAETPVTLRRCNAGEQGSVISRYNRIAGYDWVAIPLIPYLYAVEKQEDVPLYANSKLVAFLRDRYRHANLQEIAPDELSGEIPGGDWVQLIGSLYDRTSYGFQMDTTPAQDDDFIAWFNSLPNRAKYNAVSRNCADFVREIVNFYYPKAVSRGLIADLDITTPKHAAKSLVTYAQHNPELELKRIVFPQVPGTIKRSRPVRGVLESVFRAKKYVLPLAVFHPIIAGGVMSVYIFGDRFNPAREAQVFSFGNPETPLSKDQRLRYLKNLETGKSLGHEVGLKHDEASWRQFQETAKFQVDESGRVVAAGRFGNEEVQVGISRDLLSVNSAPAELQRGLLLSRMHQQLSQKRSPQTSETQFRADWRLLQAVDSAEREQAFGHSNVGN